MEQIFDQRKASSVSCSRPAQAKEDAGPAVRSQSESGEIPSPDCRGPAVHGLPNGEAQMVAAGRRAGWVYGNDHRVNLTGAGNIKPGTGTQTVRLILEDPTR